MALLDTHAHLTDPLFAGDLPAVLGRAAARDVTRIICVSSSPEDAAAAHALAARHAPVVHAAAGLHPELVARLTDAEADAAVAAVGAQLRARARAYVAVGEIGLDHSPHVVAAGVGGEAAVRARQRRAFEALLALAQEHGLPVSVHSRGTPAAAPDVCAETPPCARRLTRPLRCCSRSAPRRPGAGRRAVDMLLEAEGVRAVLHCFDGERPVCAACRPDVMITVR
jgi:TatD DNase family protein